MSEEIISRLLERGYDADLCRQVLCNVYRVLDANEGFRGDLDSLRPGSRIDDLFIDPFDYLENVMALENMYDKVIGEKYRSMIGKMIGVETFFEFVELVCKSVNGKSD